jgi:hypothetical protein
MYVSVPVSFWLDSMSFPKMVLNSSRRAGTTRIAAWTATFGILFSESERACRTNQTTEEEEVVAEAGAEAEYTEQNSMDRDRSRKDGRPAHSTLAGTTREGFGKGLDMEDVTHVKFG